MFSVLSPQSRTLSFRSGLQQHEYRPSAAILGTRLYERQHFVALTQPVTDFSFQHRLRVL